ncbi:hypothetical protein CYMTET_30409, partial [Cymbomonas tetramitiformis]
MHRYTTEVFFGEGRRFPKPIALTGKFHCFCVFFAFSALFGCTECNHIFLHDLDPIFQQHQHQAGFTVLFSFNFQQRDLAHNLVSNFRTNDITNYVAVTNAVIECKALESAGQDTFVTCSTINHKSLLDRKEEDNGYHYGVDPRWRYALAALRVGTDVLWIDTEVLFVRHPGATVALLRKTTDAAFSSEQAGASLKITSAFGYMKAVNGSVEVMERLLKDMSNVSSHAEQRQEGAWRILESLARVLTFAVHENQSEAGGANGKDERRGEGASLPDVSTTQPISVLSAAHGGWSGQLIPEGILSTQTELLHIYEVARKAGSAVLLDSLPLAVRLQGAQDTAASQHLKELVRSAHLLHMWGAPSRMKPSSALHHLVRVFFT